MSTERVDLVTSARVLFDHFETYSAVRSHDQNSWHLQTSSLKILEIFLFYQFSRLQLSFLVVLFSFSPNLRNMGLREASKMPRASKGYFEPKFRPQNHFGSNIDDMNFMTIFLWSHWFFFSITIKVYNLNWSYELVIKYRIYFVL